jgi:hypothetical protein
LSPSSPSVSRGHRGLTLPENPIRDSSMSSPPCPTLISSHRALDEHKLESPSNQGRIENSLPSNETGRQEEKCRRSIRVTNGVTRPVGNVGIISNDLERKPSGPQIYSWEFMDAFLPILKKIPACFSALQTLDFDVFQLIALPKPFHDMPLLTTTVTSLYRLHTIERLKISWFPVVKFLTNIEAAYNDHPYHSKWHAADVVGTMAYFLGKRWFKQSLTPVHQLIGLLAAASHDVDHNAQTNAFHRLAKTPIGTLYAASNLEHYHINVAKKILDHSGCDWTSKLHNWDQLWTSEAVWKLFSNLILGTDSATHDPKKQKPFGTFAGFFDKERKNSAEYALTEILHLADISNATKPLRISRKWSVRFYEEFDALGKEVRRLHLNIPLFQDPEKMPTLADTQIFFISNVCLPSFEDLVKFMPEVEETLDNLQRNLKYWKAEKESMVKRKNLVAEWQLDVSNNDKGVSTAVGLQTSFISSTDLKSSQTIKIIGVERPN